jgi:hypothetical protein
LIGVSQKTPKVPLCDLGVSAVEMFLGAGPICTVPDATSEK